MRSPKAILEAYASLLRLSWVNPSDEEIQMRVHAFERRHEPLWLKWRDDEEFRTSVEDEIKDDPGLHVVRHKQGIA